jgi:hypothetical protein
MRVSIICPFDCEDEVHELVVEPEHYLGRLGWDGGIEEGEALPCGSIPSKKQFDEILEHIHDRIIESAHPDP